MLLANLKPMLHTKFMVCELFCQLQPRLHQQLNKREFFVHKIVISNIISINLQTLKGNFCFENFRFSPAEEKKNQFANSDCWQNRVRWIKYVIYGNWQSEKYIKNGFTSTIMHFSVMRIFSRFSLESANCYRHTLMQSSEK